MTNTNRETVTGFEVISLDGRDLVTLEINGRLYDMPAAVAKVLAADLKRAVKRAGV
jgi:hypothetical protein